MSKLDAIHNVVGLPIETLHSLQNIAEAINSDVSLLDTSMKAITLNSDLTYVNMVRDSMIRTFFNHDTVYVSNIKLLTKSDKVNTYLGSDANMIVYDLQAKLTNCDQLNDLDSVDKFKWNAVSNDLLALQHNDVSIVFDVLELSCDTFDKSSFLKS